MHFKRPENRNIIGLPELDHARGPASEQQKTMQGEIKSWAKLALLIFTLPGTYLYPHQDRNTHIYTVHIYIYIYVYYIYIYVYIIYIYIYLWLWCQKTFHLPPNCGTLPGGPQLKNTATAFSLLLMEDKTPLGISNPKGLGSPHGQQRLGTKGSDQHLSGDFFGGGIKFEDSICHIC